MILELPVSQDEMKRKMRRGEMEIIAEMHVVDATP